MTLAIGTFVVLFAIAVYGMVEDGAVARANASEGK